jgi:predicted component of type VI protein secretion system
MSEPESPHTVNLSVDPHQGETRAAVTRETPFSILVLGDFSGRGLGCIARRSLDWKPIRVTPDNLPDLAGLTTRMSLSLPNGGGPTELRIDGLQAFHPDELSRRIPLLAELRAERKRVAAGEPLSDRFETLRKPQAELEGVEDAPAKASSPSGSSNEAAPADPTDLEGLLDAIVDRDAPGPSKSARSGKEEIRAFAKEVVRPHVVKDPDVRAGDLEWVDATTSHLLRTVLRQEPLMRLEGLWRSLVFLLSRVDTTGKVRVYIADVSKSELEADVTESGRRLARLLTAPDLGPTVPRWACVVGAYAFGTEERDTNLLSAIARRASQADIPWLSEASPNCVGSPDYLSLEDPEGWSLKTAGGWAKLRGSEEANWIGLAIPGFQARDAYGENGLRTRVPAFEEAPADSSHLVWSNAAFAWVTILARSFASQGWPMGSPSTLDIAQVPVALTTDGTPLGPARSRLTVPAAQAILRAGLAPLIGFPHEARVRLGGERSLSIQGDPPRAWWRA